MIKKVEVNGLLSSKLNLEWDMQKVKYLYGPNGIGKSTMLDSVFYALTNNREIFKNSENGSYRKIPYENLKIKLENNMEIEVFGNNTDVNIKRSLEKITKKQSVQLPIPISDDLNKFLLKVEQDLRLYSNDFDGKVNSDVIDDFIEIIKKNKNEYDAVKRWIHSLYIKLMNAENEAARKDIVSKYEVLYLTVERMAPDLIRSYDNENMAVFKSDFKYKLVKTIKKTIEDFNTEMTKFINQINSLTNKSVVDFIKLEFGEGDDDKNISLDSDKEIVFKVIADYLKIDSNIVDEINKNDEINGKPFTSKIINIINNVNSSVVENISNMIKFIEEVNDFFKTNDKAINWEDMSKSPIVIDKNNPDLTIEQYMFSSGERQIIKILFAINFIKSDNLLILADEIEISLSPDWQEMLYEKISNKKRVQLIGVTHSPFVVSEKDISKGLGRFLNVKK